MKSERVLGHPELDRVFGSWRKSHRTNVVHVGVEYNAKDFQWDAIDRHAEVMCMTQASDDLIS